MPVLVRGERIHSARGVSVGDLTGHRPRGQAMLVLHADHRLHASAAAVGEIEGIGEVANAQWSGAVAAVPPGRYSGRAWISGGPGKATDFGFAIAPGETLHLLAREQMGGFGFSARIFPATDANSVARAAGARAMPWRGLAPGITALTREEVA